MFLRKGERETSRGRCTVDASKHWHKSILSKADESHDSRVPVVRVSFMLARRDLEDTPPTLHLHSPEQP